MTNDLPISSTVVVKSVPLIDICAVYWHFLLAVWLVLFGLMLTS